MTDTAAPPPASPLTRALDTLAAACRVVAIAGLVIITAVQAWQVFGRYVLNDSPGWTEPVAVFFMSLTVMTAAAVGVRDGTHFNFPNVRDAMPAGLARAVTLVLHALTLAAAATLSVWGWQLAAAGWDVHMAGAALPAGLRYLPLGAGGALMAVFAAERLAGCLKPPSEA